MTSLQLPVIVTVDMDLLYGRKCNDPGRGGAEYVLRKVRDSHGPYGPRIFEIRDFRPEAERFAGFIRASRTLELPRHTRMGLRSR
jgi:hypothetical protein